MPPSYKQISPTICKFNTLCSFISPQKECMESYINLICKEVRNFIKKITNFSTLKSESDFSICFMCQVLEPKINVMSKQKVQWSGKGGKKCLGRESRLM